jgi:hypothetical protein
MRHRVEVAMRAVVAPAALAVLAQMRSISLGEILGPAEEVRVEISPPSVESDS